MKETTWIEYVTAVGAIATPLLVLLLTAVGWRFRMLLERRVALEDKLREGRVAIYNEILEPFILLLMTDAAWQADPKNRNVDRSALATQKLLSLEYRQQGFRLSLIGSDAVVKAYNSLMQYFFQRAGESKKASEADVKSMMDLLGRFLLEIRRSTGNESTKLDNWGMLEWFLTDARKYRG